MRRCVRRRRCWRQRRRGSMSRAKSSKPAVASQRGSRWVGGRIERLIVLAFCMLEIWIVKSAGSRRGSELMPWPDGLEYAAAAVNLAKGWGAVLHFGGYTYPSRYTGGSPLILEFFRHGFHGFIRL